MKHGKATQRRCLWADHAGRNITQGITPSPPRSLTKLRAASHGDEAELQPAAKNQYWTCVGGQVPHYWHCRPFPDLLLDPNIKYLATFARLLCTIMDPEPRRCSCRRHRFAPDVCVDAWWLAATNHWSVCQRGETRQTRARTRQSLPDGPLRVQTKKVQRAANCISRGSMAAEMGLILAQTQPNGIRHDLIGATINI